jgi:Ser/Thr protein kinase RdoA (MazF antagonist)
VFDFEMMCYSWYINDIATVLYYAIQYPRKQDETSFEKQFLEYFLEGYEKEHSIEQADLAQIPIFLLYRDLMVYGFLCKMQKQKTFSDQENEYLNRLQQSIKKRKLALDNL